MYRAHEYGGNGDAPITYEYCRSIEPGDKRRKQLNDVRNRAWGNLEVGYNPDKSGSQFCFWYDLSRMKLVEAWLNCEYPKNGGASFYNTKTGQYYVPKTSDLNEPWNSASEAERENMIPVHHRNWDWNPIHLVYPIPTKELTANPLCEQNPGY